MNTQEIKAEQKLKIFASRLAERRKVRGLNQRQAAEYEGVTQAYISNLENGHNTPALIALVAGLAELYKTSVDYMCGLTNDPTPATRRELSPSLRELRDVFDRLTPVRQDELIALAKAMRDNQHRIEEENQKLLRLIEAQGNSHYGSRTTDDMAQSTIFTSVTS